MRGFFVNMYRPILKMIVVAFVLLNNAALFSMKSNYKGILTIPKSDTLTVSKPYNIGSLIPDAKEYLIDHLDNPVTFGQTNKTNHELVKRQGRRNLRLAYEKNDPSFVLNHYVPILPVCRHKDRYTYRFDIISPYDKTFYCSKNSDNELNELDEKIRVLGEKRLQQIVDQKQMQYRDVYLGANGSTPNIMNDPLCLVALFGSQKDIEKELQKEVVAYWGGSNTITYALHALIDNFDIKVDNNALEILFKDPRALYVGDSEKVEDRGKMYFALLNWSRKANNRKAFEIFITEDIHDSKNLQWVNSYGCHCKEDFPPAKTALDIMLENNEKCEQKYKDGITEKHIAGLRADYKVGNLCDEDIRKQMRDNYEDDLISEKDIALMRTHGAKTTQKLCDNQPCENRERCIIS
jgi:hypothetical protein